MATKKDSSAEDIQQDLTTTLPDDEPVASADKEPATKGVGISRLDRSKDYGEVYGMAGVTYIQGDKYFNREGLEVTLQLEA